MVDEEVGDRDPLRLRNYPHQVDLDLHRVGGLRQPEALREPLDMRVDHDAGRNAEGMAEDHVRRLPSHAGERHQILDSLATGEIDSAEAMRRLEGETL
jgi:hypothetical protein